MVANILVPDHQADAFVSPEDPDLSVSLVSHFGMLLAHDGVSLLITNCIILEKVKKRYI